MVTVVVIVSIVCGGDGDGDTNCEDFVGDCYDGDRDGGDGVGDCYDGDIDCGDVLSVAMLPCSLQRVSALVMAGGAGLGRHCRGGGTGVGACALLGGQDTTDDLWPPALLLYPGTARPRTLTASVESDYQIIRLSDYHLTLALQTLATSQVQKKIRFQQEMSSLNSVL